MLYFEIISVAPIIFLLGNISLNWGSANFLVNCQIVNVIGFRDHTQALSHIL